MLVYLAEGNGKPERRQVREMSFLWTPMPMEGKLARLRRRKRWKKLRKMGVRRAVFPESLAGEAETWGVGRVEVYPLRRAVYEQLLPERGITARLRAPQVNGAVEQSAMTLAQRYRYLRLETGRGTETLAQALLRRYGLGGGGCGEAEMTVSFGGKPTAEREICLGEDCRLWQQMEYEEIPGLEGWKFSEELLCVLFQGGAVRKEEIHVKRLTGNA